MKIQKGLFILSWFILLGNLPLNVESQVVNVFPWVENFDNFPVCGVACNSICVLPLPSGLKNDTTDQLDWLADAAGTESPLTGPDADHTTGSPLGIYLYLESSTWNCGYAGKEGHLRLPTFDFSGLTSPQLTFWYNMYGSTMGTIHVDASTDGGQNWILDIVPTWTDNQNLWQKATVPLGAYAGQLVELRLRGKTGGSWQSDMAIDDLRVNDLLPHDIGVIAIDSLSSDCGLGTGELVYIRIKNFGFDTLFAGSRIPLGFDAGTGPITDTLIILSNLAPGDTISHLFPQTIDLSLPATYLLTAWTALVGDSLNTLNDLFSLSVENIPTIYQFPYMEDFSLGESSWLAGGANSSWAWGSPRNRFISSSPNCSSEAWVSGLEQNYNAGENSWVLSPCFDFSGLAMDPVIQFDHIFQTETCCDNGWLEQSTDGGLTWQKTGAAGTGNNWYNDPVNTWWEGNSGNPGSWRRAENVLSGLAGQFSVRLRFRLNADQSVQKEGFGFDNLLIASQLTDAGVQSLLSPQNTCNLGAAENISVSIRNHGTDTLQNVQLCYRLNGGAPVCEVFPQMIGPSASVNLTFSVAANLALPGDYELVVYSNLPGDQIVCNDTFRTSVTHIPVVDSYPYMALFDNVGDGWFSGGTNSSWERGTPAKNVINSAVSAPNVWVTGGLDERPYESPEYSWVQGPCFDFTNLPQGAWMALKVWWNSENNWDGAAVEFSTNGGFGWSRLGQFGDPDWYNTDSINAFPAWDDHGWSGRTAQASGSNGWFSAKNSIPDSLRGLADIRFRIVFASDGTGDDDGFAFDNFAIGLPASVDLGPDTTVCSGYQLTAGAGLESYQWSTGETGPSVTLINTSGLNDTLQLVFSGIDTLGFLVTDSAQIILQSAPFIDIQDTNLCAPGGIFFMGNNPGLVYRWSTGSQQPITIAYTEGTYWVRVRDSAGVCTYTDTFQVFARPKVQLPSDDVICTNDSIYLTPLLPNPGAGYLWSTGQTGQGILVAQSGLYWVEIRDSFNCVARDTIILDSMGVPEIIIVLDTTGCPLIQYSALSVGSPSANLLWRFGDGLGVSTLQNGYYDYSPAGQGTYLITLTTQNECGFAYFSEVVHINCLMGSAGENATGSNPGNQPWVWVWPNPAENEMNIRWTQQANRIEVMDALGRRVFELIPQKTSRNEGELNLEIASWTKGIYYLQVWAENGESQTIKIVH